VYSYDRIYASELNRLIHGFKLRNLIIRLYSPIAHDLVSTEEGCLMQRLTSRLPLSIAVLADLAVAEGRPEEAIELIRQAFELADAMEEQHRTARRSRGHASTTVLAEMEMEAA
jgi:hypothetical protein